MPKRKWNLNAIYISERLQESLRPISRCTLTTVVAPMGYGKTTAVNWFLQERAKAEDELKRTEAKLQNEKFTARAPAQVVEAERAKAEKARALLAQLQESAQRLEKLAH